MEPKRLLSKQLLETLLWRASIYSLTLILREATEQFKERIAPLCELKTNTTWKPSTYYRNYEFWVMLQLKCVNPAILSL